MIHTLDQLREYFLKNDIKVIALDLDRTTLASDSTLAPRTKAAIQASIEAGLEVVVISGRPRCSLPQEVLEIPGIHYLVTSNGAAVNKRIYIETFEKKDNSENSYLYKNKKEVTQQISEEWFDTVEEKRIWAWTLKPEAALGILEQSLPYYQKEQLAYETFVEGIAYASEDYVNQPTKYGAPQRAISYVRDTRIPIADFPAFIREHVGKLDSFDMIVPEEACFEEVKQRIAERVQEVYITSSMKRMIEVASKDAGKASGLRFILQDLNLEPKHAIAFGDGNNDADMLAYAGLGVAMANAMPLCLEHADYISKSNDEYGVAEVLELLLEMKK